MDVYTGIWTMRTCKQQCADVDMDIDKTDMHRSERGMDRDMEGGHGDKDMNWPRVPGQCCFWNIWPMGLRTLDTLDCAFDCVDMCNDFPCTTL